MLDHFQSLFDKLRKPTAASLRLNYAPSDKTAVMQSGADRKGKPVLAELLPCRSRATGISFSVDKVERSERGLPLTTLLENFEIRGGTSVLILPEQTSPSVAPEGFFTKQHGLDQHEFLNPLIEAVHLAFSGHRPLALSPDCIWLTIVQGFAHHVNKYAEDLRGRIVRHEGKKVLCVRTDSLEPAAWPQLVSQFSAQIRDNSDPVLCETLLCDFSTTTPNIRTANEVALMDAYQRYFQYIAMCICGIPTITLEGTPSDWQRIRDRIELLATFGLEWWTSRLAPILDEFIATANGAPDLSFWQAIYKPQRAYATEMATGWIADLFPYLGNASNRTRNPMLDMQRTDWLPPELADQRFKPGVSLKSIPCGLSRAPLTLSFPDKPSVELNLVGGSLASRNLSRT
ncbi:MAG TPA: DUF4419 domain-containing protein [Candidatus Acidoferrum sp.]